MFERIRIGRLIRYLRINNGMSQLELSKKTGLMQSSIARIESGKFNVGFDTLQRISEVFDCEVSIIKVSNSKK